MLGQLQNVFQKVFRNNDLIISKNTSFKDIKMWDSQMHMELIATIEKEFNIVFSFTQVMSFKGVGDIIKEIEHLKKS